MINYERKLGGAKTEAEINAWKEPKHMDLAHLYSRIQNSKKIKPFVQFLYVVSSTIVVWEPELGGIMCQDYVAMIRSVKPSSS